MSGVLAIKRQDLHEISEERNDTIIIGTKEKFKYTKDLQSVYLRRTIVEHNL
jgi:hypothetical protein